MKKVILTLVFFVLMAIPSFAQEPDTEMSEEMEAWMEYMTPGPMHQMLASLTGEWNTKVTYWMAPNSEPQSSDGSTRYEMILGGRYQKSTHHGTMVGMPFEGMGIIAFDNASEEFYSVWIDNMGTGMMMSKGKYNEATNTVDMDGFYIDPMTKDEQPLKQSFKMIDDNKHIFEMYVYHEGKKFKSLEVEYTRK